MFLTNRRHALFMSLLCSLPTMALAEADAKGCKDHPLFTRLPGNGRPLFTELIDRDGER